MKSVLITGSTGFVGSNLIDYLFDKGMVIYVLNREHQENHKIKRSYIWDEFESAKFDHIDAIVHLAGKAHDIKNTSQPEDYFKINVRLTQVVFDWFLKSPIPDFIYFSSVKAVADTVDDVLYEVTNYTAKTPYGQSKQKAEEYILSQDIANGKRVFILRPCMIHGPGNKGNLNLLYKFVSKKIPYPLAAFKNRRSFLSIDNLTIVLAALITNPTIQGGIYNLADDGTLSTNAVITIIGEVSHIKSRLLNVPPAVIIALAKIGDILHLPLNSELLKKLTESYVVDNTKIKKALNLDNLPISSTEGLKSTIKSFQR